MRGPRDNTRCKVSIVLLRGKENGRNEITEEIRRDEDEGRVREDREMDVIYELRGEPYTEEPQYGNRGVSDWPGNTRPAVYTWVVNIHDEGGFTRKPKGVAISSRNMHQKYQGP